MIDNNIKKIIDHDWQKEFPLLKKFAQNKYYQILGPLLIGLELIWPPKSDDYHPHFVMYSLWGSEMGNNLKACLSGPILLQQFYTKKKLQLSIPYSKHADKFPEVIESINKQLPFQFGKDISLNDILLTIKKYSERPPLSVAPNSYLQACLQEDMLSLALCCGADKEARHILARMKTIKWDKAHFLMFDIDSNVWLDNVELKLTKKDEIQAIVQENKSDKKLAKLESYNVIV